MTGLEEGLFPLAKAAQDPQELEEERRLFYVGATRAEEALFLTYARTRYRYGESTSAVRSRFLDELEGEDLMRTEAGATFKPRTERFQLPDDDGAQGGYRVEYDADGGYSYESTPAQRRAAKSGYEQMDPHYYRTSLRPDAAKPARKTRASGARGRPPEASARSSTTTASRQRPRSRPSCRACAWSTASSARARSSPSRARASARRRRCTSRAWGRRS